MKSSENTALVEPVAHAEGEHVLPLRTYLVIYGALLVLTYVTVQVSLLNLGEVAIYAALAVAIVKALMVAGYFMHLKFDARFNTFVFASSVGFLILFGALTMADVTTRDAVVVQEGNEMLRRDKAFEAQRAKQAAQPAPEPAAPSDSSAP